MSQTKKDKFLTSRLMEAMSKAKLRDQKIAAWLGVEQTELAAFRSGKRAMSRLQFEQISEAVREPWEHFMLKALDPAMSPLTKATLELSQNLRESARLARLELDPAHKPLTKVKRRVAS